MIMVRDLLQREAVAAKKLNFKAKKQFLDSDT